MFSFDNLTLGEWVVAVAVVLFVFSVLAQWDSWSPVKSAQAKVSGVVTVLLVIAFCLGWLDAPQAVVVPALAVFLGVALLIIRLMTGGKEAEVQNAAKAVNKLKDALVVRDEKSIDLNDTEDKDHAIAEELNFALIAMQFMSNRIWRATLQNDGKILLVAAKDVLKDGATAASTWRVTHYEVTTDPADETKMRIRTSWIITKAKVQLIHYAAKFGSFRAVRVE